MPDLIHLIFPRIDATSTPRTWPTNRFAACACPMTFGAKTGEQGGLTQLDLCSSGASEQMIGKWGKARGSLDDLAMATKGRFTSAKGSHRASRSSLTRAVEGSLKSLGQEVIDVYFVYGWDRHNPILETLVSLLDLVKAGKIHNIG